MLSRLQLLFSGAVLLLSLTGQSRAISLEEAEAEALAREPGIAAQMARAQALSEDAVAAGQLPDPQLQLGALNLPVDSFDLDQEPMTQLRVGFSQQFPAGDTRALRRSKTEAMSEAMRASAAERRAMVLRELRGSWLEYQYWLQAREITRARRAVFEQLASVVRSQYQVGQSDQHDLVQSEFAVGRVDERLMAIDQSLLVESAALQRWLARPLSTQDLPAALPAWTLDQARAGSTLDGLRQRLLQHPTVRAAEHAVRAEEEGVQLARQSYRPDWGVNVGYGFRDGSNLDGSSRDDFFSAQLNFKLPLFTDQRQDRQVRASVYRHQAALAQRSELLDRLKSDLDKQLQKASHQQQRLDFFETRLLAQSEQRSATTLTAYRAERATFADLIDAVSSELDTALAHRRLRIDYLQSLARLRYFLDESHAEETDHE